MEFKDFVGAMRRRWYAVLLAALAVFACSVLVLGRVGPTYEAEASVVLMPPLGNKVISENEYSRGNPLFYLGGLSQSRDILIDRLSDGEAAALVEEAAGPDADFSLDGDPSSGAPILVITGEAPTPEGALAAALAVRDAVPAELNDLQSSLDIPLEARVLSLDLTIDEKATTIRKAQIRTALLVVGGLTAISLLLIALLDGFVMSLRRPELPAGAPTRPGISPPPAEPPESAGPPAPEPSTHEEPRPTDPQAQVPQRDQRRRSKQGQQKARRPPVPSSSGRRDD